MTRRDSRFDVPEANCSVSALLLLSADARVVYVLGHGAGAGMHHAFLETIAVMLAELDVGTFRYQFPYMELGKKRPDYRRVLQGTVRAALPMESTVRTTAQSNGLYHRPSTRLVRAYLRQRARIEEQDRRSGPSPSSVCSTLR